MFLGVVICLTNSGIFFLKPSGLSESSTLTFVAGMASKWAPGRGTEHPTCLGLHHTALLGPLPEKHNEQSWPGSLGEAPGFSPREGQAPITRETRAAFTERPKEREAQKKAFFPNMENAGALSNFCKSRAEGLTQSEPFPVHFFLSNVPSPSVCWPGPSGKSLGLRGRGGQVSSGLPPSERSVL